MSTARRWMLALGLAAVLGVVVDPLPAGASTGTVQVDRGVNVNVRSGPSTSYQVLRTVAAGSSLAVLCQVSGQDIAGSVRTTSAWDQLADGGFVTDAYVAWSGPVPGLCGAAGPAIAAAVVEFPAYSGATVNQRVNATTLVTAVGDIPHGQPLSVTCQLGGQTEAGPAGTSMLWDRLSTGALVSDAYVAWPAGRPAVPWCSLATAEAPTDHAGFIVWAGALARQLRGTYHVPASVTVAQAILESGWGGSPLTLDGNSFFGMKCFGTPGPVATGCRPYPTQECEDSGCYSTSASFRVYSTAMASFVDHANALWTLPRYRAAFDHPNSPDRFAVELQRAGYATSPTYAQTLTEIMGQFDLYRYDSAA